MQNSWAKLIEHELFVVRCAGVRAITPAQNDGTHAVRGEPLDDGSHHGRLAGPASSQIADADNRNRSTVGLKHTDVKQSVSSANSNPVEERCD
jgi:hypothetical protein